MLCVSVSSGQEKYADGDHPLTDWPGDERRRARRQRETGEMGQEPEFGFASEAASCRMSKEEQGTAGGTGFGEDIHFWLE